MQLFYLPQLNNNTFEFSEEESKHCIRVLRKKKGDAITLIDGKGTEAIGIIDSDNPKKCSGLIQQKTLHPKPQGTSVHLVICPTKNTDRIEWMLEKCIELGIDQISFIYSENSERNKINLERCEKIAVSAIKQSKQFYLPQINPIQSFEQFMQQKDSVRTEKYICWCPTAQTETLTKQVAQSKPSSVQVLVGPEGDFTQKEIQLAEAQGYKACSLGSTILRSETAGLFAVTALVALNQLNA